jgi:hypothetical protein
MPGRSTAKVILLVVLFLGVIAVLRFKPWERQGGSRAKEQLRVGFLPVT